MFEMKGALIIISTTDVGHQRQNLAADTQRRVGRALGGVGGTISRKRLGA